LPAAAAVLAIGLVLLAAGASAQTPATGDTTVTMPEFDPDLSQGGIDLWRAQRLPDGTFDVPVNLGPHVNTTRRETSPYVSADGSQLFFASRGRRDSFGKEDLYVCERLGDGWGPARNLGLPVNSAASEFGPCLFPDGVTLVYSRYDAQQQAFDLILSVQFEEEWLDPIPFGAPLYSPANECLPSLTADGRQLYFAATRKAGYGSYDLFVSYRDDTGSWSDPQNLGPRINSAHSDYSPGVSPDGTRLYFSSQRDELGNFDLYVVEQTEGGTWGEPRRLPPPINTRLTEYCPFVDRDGSLYFASDRRTGSVQSTDEIEE
jgi:Tol biopolymer transport system component